MNVSGERVLIFGDSLSHNGSDDAPEIWDVDQGSNRASSAPGDLLASAIWEAGADAVRIDANVGRSAINFWRGGSRWQHRTSDDLIADDQAFAPSTVIVMLGTNDLGSDPRMDAAGFQQIVSSFPGAKLLAIGPPIFADDRLNQQAEVVYDTLASVFDRVIDARPLSSTVGRVGDGVHFGASAARDFADQLAAKVLAKQLGIGSLLVGAIAFVVGGWFARF